MCVYVYICTCIRTHVCVNMYIYMYICIYHVFGKYRAYIYTGWGKSRFTVCMENNTKIVPGWVAQLVQVSSFLMCQGCRFSLWSGYIQEATNKCMNKLNNKSVFISFPPSLPPPFLFLPRK